MELTEYPYKSESYKLWLARLKNEPNRVCTNDVGLDQIETTQLLNSLHDGCTILEVGCGNGLLYESIRDRYAIKRYVGLDIVKEFIQICVEKKRSISDDFLHFDMTEISSKSFEEKFDFIISKRSIQNITDASQQFTVMDELGNFITDNGLMIFVESSSLAQRNINEIRIKHKLPKITPPFHNLFLDDKLVSSYNFRNIVLANIVPFASDFYYITRIIYARYANEYLNEPLQYDHALQKIALSMQGDNATTKYSQIQAYVFKKKSLNIDFPPNGGIGEC